MCNLNTNLVNERRTPLHDFKLAFLFLYKICFRFNQLNCSTIIYSTLLRIHVDSSISKDQTLFLSLQIDELY